MYAHKTAVLPARPPARPHLPPTKPRTILPTGRRPSSPSPPERCILPYIIQPETHSPTPAHLAVGHPLVVPRPPLLVDHPVAQVRHLPAHQPAWEGRRLTSSPGRRLGRPLGAGVRRSSRLAAAPPPAVRPARPSLFRPPGVSPSTLQAAGWAGLAGQQAQQMQRAGSRLALSGWCAPDSQRACARHRPARGTCRAGGQGSARSCGGQGPASGAP